MSLKQRAIVEFQRRFGKTPHRLVRAPGRVNLIGEHTDYNDGFVLPIAIDRTTWIAFTPRNDRRVVACSTSLDGAADFSLDALTPEKIGWPEYLKGVAFVLERGGQALSGWQGVVVSDVPIGAGLSSSAALELATTCVFSAVSSLSLSPEEMAAYGQRAENEWVGVHCGIMDQMISATGLANHAILIDCRSLELKPVPLPANTSVLILDTNTRRGLIDSAYNERRTQCQAAAMHFAVSALREVGVEAFEDRANQLEETIRRRARHVITENQRTLEAAAAMMRQDAAKLGQLMHASHLSLKNDFEVSCRELDQMVQCAMDAPGCLGVRMTGAGFGGCAVALVRDEAVDDFIRQVAQQYRQATALEPVLHVSKAADGASVVGHDDTG